MVYIGCDQHKDFCQLAVLDEEGRMIEQKKLYHDDRESLKRYFTSLPKGSEMAVEASGFESWFADFVQTLGVKVHLSHPLKTRAIAEAKIKTDKVDAKILGELLYADLIPPAYLAPMELQRKRFFLRYRLCLNRYRSSVKNRIHSILHRLGLRPPAVTDLFGRRGRTYLNQLQLDQEYQTVLTGYLKVLDQIQSIIQQTDQRIRVDFQSNEEARLLETIPGIGPFLSQLILAEIGSLNRFQSPGRLGSYAGLVPGLHQSGQRRYQKQCGPEGNKFLRWALIEAAQVAVRKDPGLKSFYERIKRKKNHQMAIVATARKLVVILFCMLLRKQPYRFTVET